MKPYKPLVAGDCMNKNLIVGVCAFLLACIGTGEAQIPRTLSYQGVLTDSLGVPKPDGTYTFAFKLYEAPSGMTALWSEQKTLQVKHGLFSTVLGDQVPFTPSITFDRQYWMGIQLASEPEMVPRIPLTSSGYSFSSIRSDTAQYALQSPPQAAVDSARIAGTVPNNSITGQKIVDSTITGAQLSRNSTLTIASLHASGNVGIGTSNPARIIQTETPINNYSYSQTNGAIELATYLNGGYNSGMIGTVSNHPFQIYTSNSGPVMTMTTGGTSGKVGIGTATPSGKLEVGVANEGDLAMRLLSGPNAFLDIVPTGLTNTVLSTVNNRNLILSPGNGAIGIGTTTPSGNMLDVASDFGGPGNSAIRALYPTGGQLAGTEFGALAHRDGFWSAVYAKGGTGGAIGLYSDGKALVKRGTGSIATSTDAVLQEENFNTTGNGGWFRNASPTNTDALLKLHIHPSSTSDFVDGWTWDGGSTLTRKFHISAAGTYTAGSDFAEAFDATGGKAAFEPGDVVVLSENNSRGVEKTSTPYDTRVAGVYSTRPGVLGADKEGITRMDENDIPIAIVGIVPTKVTDENGPIRPGDLLTTSSVPGHAMKATPVDVNGLKIYPAGTIIGKALGRLPSGEGVIRVLVTLK